MSGRAPVKPAKRALALCIEALREILAAEEKRDVIPVGWVKRAKEAISAAQRLR